MRKGRNWRIKSPKYIDLSRRIINVVITPNNMGDFHIDIVDYDSEIVGRRTVSPNDDGIIQLFILNRDRSAYCVVKRHRAFKRCSKSYNRFDLSSGNVDPITAPAIVSGFQSTLALTHSHLIELFFRAITTVSIIFV